MYENRLGKLRDGGTVAYYYEGGATLTRYDLADDLDPTFRDAAPPVPHDGSVPGHAREALLLLAPRGHGPLEGNLYLRHLPSMSDG
ncbi:MAG: hypothetical protein OXF79_04810 [Chloroflexi bacterium]|nr:hypothetical protein [Chloroflexota bacterium]